MSAAQRFTVKTLEGLPPAPAGKRVYVNDTEVRGLQAAVTPRRTRVFCLYRKVSGKPTRPRLGDYPAMTIEQAPNKVRALLNPIADGVDPTTEKRAERAGAVTLAEVFAAYCAARKNLEPNPEKPRA